MLNPDTAIDYCFNYLSNAIILPIFLKKLKINCLYL